MKELIIAIKICLQNENWYAALFVALELPDICGKLENPNLKSQERYVKWFNKYLSAKYIHEIGPEHKVHVFLTGEDCYALRCAYLHEGIGEITGQRCQQVLDNFRFTTDSSHCNYMSGRTLQLQVKIFCEEICEAADRWLVDMSTDSETQKRISKMLKIYDSIFTRDEKGIHIP